MRLVASIPSPPGMRRSMRTTSGAFCSTRATAASPLDAAPTTSKPGRVSMRVTSPSLTAAWSSATRTLMPGPRSRPSSPMSLARARTRPPTSSTRSRMPCKPKPPPVPASSLAATSVVAPLSTTSTVVSGVKSRRTETSAPGACLRALVSASCAARYTASPASVPSARGSADHTEPGTFAGRQGGDLLGQVDRLVPQRMDGTGGSPPAPRPPAAAPFPPGAGPCPGPRWSPGRRGPPPAGPTAPPGSGPARRGSPARGGSVPPGPPPGPVRRRPAPARPAAARPGTSGPGTGGGWPRS